MSPSRPQKFAFALAILLVAIDLLLALKPDFLTITTAAETHASILPTLHTAVVEHFENPVIESISPGTTGTIHLPLSRRDFALCRVKIDSSITLDGDLRIQSIEREDGGWHFWVKSSNCPDELYSIVAVDEDGRIEKEIECQNTSLTELTLNSGLQFDVNDTIPDPSKRDIAISGAGRFLVNCFDGRLTLSRDGRFFAKPGALVNNEGCVPWTERDGGRMVRISPEETLDTNGCSTTTNECIEVFDVDERDVAAFNFRTKNSITILDRRALRPARHVFLFQGAAEDLDSTNRSLTGVANWEALPITPLPTQCP